MILVRRDCCELRLREDECLESLRGRGVFPAAPRGIVADVETRLVAVHRVQNHLKYATAFITSYLIMTITMTFTEVKDTSNAFGF